MLDIIFTADRDACKFRDSNLTIKEIKQIARENAGRKYPSCTKYVRGLYKHTFIKKVREYQYQAWLDELNSYR